MAGAGNPPRKRYPSGSPVAKAARRRASDVLGVELPIVRLIGDANGDVPEVLCAPRERIRFVHCAEGVALLTLALDKQSLSARGFHKVIRVARTIANLQQIAQIDRPHLAEALAYRSMPLLA